MGELAKAAEALSAPTVKLLDVVSRGIGRAYDPRYKRRMADASAYEIDTLADAVRRNSDLPILLDCDGFQLDARNIQELAERAKIRLISQEMRKQLNIEAIVDRAYKELEDDKAVSDDSVDDDWIVRFFNSVEDISNDKMRELWGRILAGEIRRPKSFSLRTLDILRSISKDEAILFERLANISFRQNKQSFIPCDMEILEESGIKYNDLFQLSCAGIISHTPLELELPVGKEAASFMNNYIIGIFSALNNDKDIKIKVSIFKYTEAGGQVLRILNISEKESSEFAIKYLAQLKRKYSTCEVSAYRIQRCEDDYVYREKTDLI